MILKEQRVFSVAVFIFLLQGFREKTTPKSKRSKKICIAGKISEVVFIP